MKTGYEVHFKKMKKNSQAGSKNKIQPAQYPAKKNKKQGFPLVSVLGGVFVLLGAAYGYQNSTQLDNYLNKVEVGVLGQASAEEKKIPQENKKVEPSASEKGLADKPKINTSTTLTVEEVALFNSLDDRKKQLDQKEVELKKLEEELHKQKEELEKRLVQLEQLRGKIANQLQERVNVDEERVEKLVAFYSTMKPQRAAKVIETLNEDLAVEILKKMKKKEAAEIMNMVEADKAQRLSEKFAGYRKN